jgi:hypothetical protein
MREAAHRMVKTEGAWRLRDSVVVMSTSIGYSSSCAMVFTAAIAALASAASILTLGFPEKMNNLAILKRHTARWAGRPSKGDHPESPHTRDYY